VTVQLFAFHFNATVDNVCQNFLNSVHPLAKNSNNLKTLHFPPFTPLGEKSRVKVLYWKRISNYVGAVYIRICSKTDNNNDDFGDDKEKEGEQCSYKC
jgi:hypothetical protein